jgi:hypothetical protein
MQMREFTKSDWHGFTGAEPWENAQPLIAEGRLEDGMDWVLVLDRNGGCLICDDDQAQNGGYALSARSFHSVEAARLFAAFLGEPKTKYEFFLAGFRKV